MASVDLHLIFTISVSQITNDGSSSNRLGTRPSAVPSSLSLLSANESTSIAPLEFPKNESTHHFLHNSTILASLAHSTNKTVTEVDDLRNYLNSTKNVDAPEELRRESPRDNLSIDPSLYKQQSEWIENGSNTEDRKRKIDSMENRHFHGSRPPLVHGQLAAILAGVFLVLSLFGYVALLSWRRFLE